MPDQCQRHLLRPSSPGYVSKGVGPVEPKRPSWLKGLGSIDSLGCIGKHVQLLTRQCLD